MSDSISASGGGSASSSSSSSSSQPYGSQGGNFKNYYSFRDQFNKKEHRLEGVSKVLIENKVCLDIGCNEGRFTSDVAKLFNPRVILGIDIDKRLSDSAQASVKREIYRCKQLEEQEALAVSNNTNTAAAAASATVDVVDAPSTESLVVKPRATSLFKPRSVVLAGAQLKSSTMAVTATNKSETITSTSSTSSATSTIIATSNATVKRPFISQSHPNPCINRDILANHLLSFPSFSPCRFPYNVNFYCENFMFQKALLDTKFEVIFCMSVTKWIHLQQGDQGILSFFRLVHRALYPDGVFILEFQHWKSYLNTRSKSLEYKAAIPLLNIRPDDFEDILLNQVGFVLVARLGTSVAEAHDFSRPILVLKKAATLELQVHSKSNLNGGGSGAEGYHAAGIISSGGVHSKIREDRELAVDDRSSLESRPEKRLRGDC